MLQNIVELQSENFGKQQMYYHQAIVRSTTVLAQSSKKGGWMIT